jgi:hypothetical protein
MANIDEKLLEALALEEEAARRSKWYIEECNNRKNIPNGWISLTDEMQRSIIKKYFTDEFDIEMALRKLRGAHHIFPENKIFKERMQVKYNRACLGTLKMGDVVPEFIQPMLTKGVNMFVGSSMT